MRIRKSLDNPFTKNVITLVSGTTVAQLIPILIIPILTRLYSPEDFGLLAMFVSIATILGVISNGRYELAIILPDDDKDAIALAILGIIVCTFFSIFTFIFIYLFHTNISELVSVNGFESVVLYIPLMVWLIGVYNIINYVLTRLRAYKKIALATIVKSSSMGLGQIVFGLMSFGGSGLILSQFIFQIVGNYGLVRYIFGKYSLKDFSVEIMLKNAKCFVKFPKYSLPAALTNTASLHFTNVLISSYFSVATLGFYSLAQKVLGLPSSFVGGAISQVFFREAAEERKESGVAVRTFDSTLKKLLVLSIPFYLICYFVVEDVFSLVFGVEWLIAGTYCKIALPMFAIRFIVSSVSAVDSVMEKQSYFMWFNIVLLCISILVAYTSRNLSFELFLTYFTYATVAAYSLYGLVLRKMAKNEI